MIKTLDVVWYFDSFITPPGWKMVVCVCQKNGFYFRINSKSWWPEAVKIKLPDHPFLNHDSHIQCYGPLELDDYLIQESLRDRGVIGRIDQKVIPDLLAAIDRDRSMTDADKDIIRTALNAFG